MMASLYHITVRGALAFVKENGEKDAGCGVAHSHGTASE